MHGIAIRIGSFDVEFVRCVDRGGYTSPVETRARARAASHGRRAALPALVLVACFGCGDGQRPLAPQTPARPARPSLRIVGITDLSGYLEPCGCQSRPLGGIDRAAARLRELRADGVPSVFLSAGKLWFGAEGEGDPRLSGGDQEAATQQRWQAEALAGILKQMGMDAAAPGAADLRFGLPALEGLAQQGGFPLLAAGVTQRSDDQPSAPAFGASVVLAPGGLRVGVWGLSDLGGAAELTGPTDFAAEARKLTDDLRKRGAAVVIGLLNADARAARRLAGAVRGLDFLLHGGADSPNVPPPEHVGQTTLLRAAHRGHGLLVVDLMRAGEGAFVDVSPWTLAAQRQALEASANELAGRIGEWRKDPNVDRAALAGQESRLARMRQDLGQLAVPPQPRGNAFSARFIELDKDAPQDPAVRALVDAHNKRVNEHTRVALAKLMPKPVAKGEPGYVGAVRCGDCHAEAFAWWKGHAHGHAYATLEQRNSQYNLSCVGCHVTGYDQPGGSTVVHNHGLTDVGCESCHGPGSVHVKNQDADEAKNVRREVPEAVCKRCHNPDHSDRFEYAKYRQKLIVPGHGLPAERHE